MLFSLRQIINSTYLRNQLKSKFIPVMLPNAKTKYVPKCLKRCKLYRLPKDFAELIYRLRNTEQYVLVGRKIRVKELFKPIKL